MIWKVLIFAIAGYVLFRLFTNDKKKNVEKEKEETQKLIANGELVKDPECGTYVDPETAISVKNGEERHHFCSYECRDAYIKRLEQ